LIFVSADNNMEKDQRADAKTLNHKQIDEMTVFLPIYAEANGI